MKRSLVCLLCVILVFSAVSCGKTEPESPEPEVTETPTPEPEVTVTPTPTPEPTKPPYRTYEYAYGNLSIRLPQEAKDPEDNGSSLIFTDPENLWTLELEPLDVHEKNIEIHNQDARIKPDGAYFKDVERNEEKYQDFSAYFWSLNYNMDNPGGMNSYYNEPIAIQVIDYGDTLVGKWGGLKIKLTGLDKATQIQDILADELVRCIWDNLSFTVTEGGGFTENMGISADFPERWGNRTADTGIATHFEGEMQGYMHINANKPADPKEAAEKCRNEIKEMDFGELHYYVTVRTYGSGESENLCLFTDFTDKYSVTIELSVTDLKGEELWAVLENKTIRNILNSIKLDPSGFTDPELKYMDSTGFKCNQVGMLTEYTGTAEEIRLPQTIGDVTITQIANGLFQDHTELKSVIVPEGYEVISYNAFSNCTSLEQIEIPLSVTNIQNNAFADCTSLKRVVFSENLTEIGYGAFKGCTSLQEVVFSEGLTTIQSDVFEDCVALGDILLPDSLEEVGSGAFRNTAQNGGTFICKGDTVFGFSALANSGFKTVQFLGKCDLSQDSILNDGKVEDLTIGEGTEVLGYAFASAFVLGNTTPLTVELPDSLKKIDSQAFSWREGLTEIDLKNVEEIEDSAFAFTGLREILIPGTVKHVKRVFNNCIDLQTIRLEEGVETIEDNAFEFVGTHNAPNGEYCCLRTDEEYEKEKEYIYPEGERKGFVNIYLPSTLKSVGAEVFMGTLVDGMYMEWCTGVDQLPDFDPTFVEDSNIAIRQIYFTKETIDAHGDELDAYFMNTNAKDACWYYTGQKAYWKSQK